MSDEPSFDSRIETLARMWIECDPNRGGNPGSGFHADDIDFETSEPRWHWFIPRAEASLVYLQKHCLLLPEESSK